MEDEDEEAGWGDAEGGGLSWGRCRTGGNRDLSERESEECVLGKALLGAGGRCERKHVGGDEGFTSDGIWRSDLFLIYA